MAKYCPEGAVMEAKERPGISYSWRSIVRGFQALKKGIIWRVGDGEQIRIWDDPWIPRGHGGQLHQEALCLSLKFQNLLIPLLAPGTFNS
jgi:hypothetical protein